MTVRDLCPFSIEEKAAGRAPRPALVRARISAAQVTPLSGPAVFERAGKARRPPPVSPGGTKPQTLEVSRRRQELFVSTLAHELRQPLSVVSAAVSVIRQAPGSDAARVATSMIERQIGQMSRSVEDLLDEMRWACGKVTIRKQRIDLRLVLRDAAEDVTAAVAARQQKLAVITPAEPLWVEADFQRLLQVFTNLLANAVKYTAARGRISMAAAQRDTAVTVSVRDTGRGIDRDALAHIFDLFAQMRPAEGAGLGLGLSVVREIVALHKGRIEARSEGSGHGTEFIVSLPIALA